MTYNVINSLGKANHYTGMPTVTKPFKFASDEL